MFDTYQSCDRQRPPRLLSLKAVEVFRQEMALSCVARPHPHHDFLSRSAIYRHPRDIVANLSPSPGAPLNPLASPVSTSLAKHLRNEQHCQLVMFFVHDNFHSKKYLNIDQSFNELTILILSAILPFGQVGNAERCDCRRQIGGGRFLVVTKRSKKSPEATIQPRRSRVGSSGAPLSGTRLSPSPKCCPKSSLAKNLNAVLANKVSRR